jgi:hypothetical protein
VFSQISHGSARAQEPALVASLLQLGHQVDAVDEPPMVVIHDRAGQE